MEILEATNNIEKFINQAAEKSRTPLGGGFELLPFCNMNCNMCYVKNNNPALWKDVLSSDQWIKIAEDAKSVGTLYILLTGGEPLLYPEFKYLYRALSEMGFILTINTNGTLITEEWADFFAEYPCRRLNITLYGASNDTYEKLCHNPKGFDQTVNALKLLKSRNLPLRINITLVKENRSDLEQIVTLARELDIPFVPTTYMFPPIRKEEAPTCFWTSRMSPAESAESRLKATFLRNADINPAEQARLLIDTLVSPKASFIRNKGFSCKASYCEYWINWKGELSPCGMIQEPKVSLLEQDFAVAWKQIGLICDEQKACLSCNTCSRRMFCQTCAAACLSETGYFAGRPEYLCQVTDEMLVKVLDYMEDPMERAEYAEKLNDIFSPASLTKVSLILPVHNNEKNLEECLDSILMQSMQNFELILIDNGSTDASGYLCDYYAKLDSRIRIIHQPQYTMQEIEKKAENIAKTSQRIFLNHVQKFDVNWLLQNWRMHESWSQTWHIQQQKMLPKVSIIIPIYNAEQYLKRCINSIFNQLLQDFELILVDDGSSDGSPKICDDFASLDSRIHVIHQENKGISAARNVGIEVAQAPYILFMDSDDYAENTWASSLYEKILAHPDSLITANTWAGNEENHHIITLHEDFPDYDHIAIEDSKNSFIFAYVWNKIYRKDLLSEIRFDENTSFNEDYLFNIEYAKRCKEAVLITDPQIIHLIHTDGLTDQGLAKQVKTSDDMDISKFGYIKRMGSVDCQVKLTHFYVEF